MIKSIKIFFLAIFIISECTGARSDLWDREAFFNGDTTQKDSSPEIADPYPESETRDGEIVFPDEIEEELIDLTDPVGEETTNPCLLPCDDGIACTEDSCDPASGCIFTPINERCNDGVDCTMDICNQLTGCIFVPVNESCDDGIPCTVDLCNREEGCTNSPDDSLCSDEINCTEDRCIPSSGGCVSTPLHERCRDSINCTLDLCNPPTGCMNNPDDTLCNAGERCEPLCGGCIVDVAPAGRFLAHSSSSLYQIDPVSATSYYVGDIGFSNVTDIAVTQNNMLWGITFTSLLSINYCTGTGTFIGNVGGTSSLNALVSAPDGMLFGADYNGDVWRIDPLTGRGTRIGNYGAGLHSSGDIAWGADGMLYGTVRTDWSPTDLLVSVDPVTGSARIIGDTGYSAVFGLSFISGVLYGLTDSGQLITINTSSGRGSSIGTIGISFWGAASPPPPGP